MGEDAPQSSAPVNAAGSTISIGVAEWSPAIGRDPFALLERADGALYLTKNRGRDGVTVATDPALPAPEPVAA